MRLVRRVNASMWAFAVLLLVLAITSSPHTIGDGGEYLAYVARFLHGAGPVVAAEEIPPLRHDVAAIDPGLSRWDFEAAMQIDRLGGRHFVHFWLYSALATPFVLLAAALHLDPRSGFTMLHALLLLAAFGVLSRRAGMVVAWLLLAGPILWWLDKPHPEVFLFTLLSMACAVWRDRPVIAMLCAGLAAAQAVPFLLIVPAILASSLVDRPELRHDRRFWIGAIGAVAVSMVAPLFYLWRFGELSPLTRLSTSQWPWAHFGTEWFDLTIGLIPNWLPFGAALLTVLTVVAISRPRELRRLEVIAAAIAMVVLLLVFPRIGNVTHGATPGLSRYGLWLAPLTVPLFSAARGLRAWHAIAIVLTVVSVAFSVVTFHPARPEFSHRPTPLAVWVWRHHPGWSTPLPRVFVNALRVPDETAPVATSGCTKALLIGRGDAQGMWPRSCPPAPVPTECRSPGALCYANRDRSDYRFRPVPGDQANFTYVPERVWPKPAEPGVLAAMAFVSWPDLEVADRTDLRGVIENVEGAEIENVWRGDQGAFVVLRRVVAAARVYLSSDPSRALVVDGDTGEVIQELAIPPGASIITVDQPRRTLVLAVRQSR